MIQWHAIASKCQYRFGCFISWIRRSLCKDRSRNLVRWEFDPYRLVAKEDLEGSKNVHCLCKKVHFFLKNTHPLLKPGYGPALSQAWGLGTVVIILGSLHPTSDVLLRSPELTWMIHLANREPCSYKTIVLKKNHQNNSDKMTLDIWEFFLLPLHKNLMYVFQSICSIPKQ